jgi:peptidoglycan/LPS O-acetylase OafA/YrhL
MDRIPTLDGWRGVAVLLVLVFHFQEFYGNQYFFGNPAFGFGEHGVMIFLVLSGYLITTTLMRREPPDLRAFYIKRFFRLMPGAWVYLLTVYVCGLFQHGAWDGGKDVLASLCFYRNAFHGTGIDRHTEQFWSLSLEEQFYFAWPILLTLVPRKALAGLLSVAAALVAFYRVTHGALFFPASGFTGSINRSWQVDEIIVGCLAAFVMARPNVQRFLARRGRAVFWIALPVVLADVYRYQQMPPLHETLLFAAMMGATITNPGMFASRVLELSHLKMTGLLCYGIYLWQGFCLTPELGPFGVVLLPVAVLASWLLIEKPAQKLGARLIAKRSSRKTEPDRVPVTA